MKLNLSITQPKYIKSLNNRCSILVRNIHAIKLQESSRAEFSTALSRSINYLEIVWKPHDHCRRVSYAPVPITNQILAETYELMLKLAVLSKLPITLNTKKYL